MPGEVIVATARAWFSKNRGLKALALLGAVVAWYGIREAISFELLVEDIPVRILHDEGWALLEGGEQTVDVRFRGARSDVRDLSRDQVDVAIDVRGRREPGPQTVRISPRDVRAPTGARPVLIRPEQVTFSLDRESEREVPVRVEVQGQVPDGFDVEQVASVPATVTLGGPSAQIDRVAFVRTVPVELDQRIQSFRVRRTLLPPEGTWTARIEPDRVQVEVTIREHAISREIAAVPVLALTRPGAPAPPFEPAVVRVTLQGGQDQLRSLEPDAIRAYIEVRDPDAAPGRSLPIRVHAPAGIRAIEIEPAAVVIGEGTDAVQTNRD